MVHGVYVGWDGGDSSREGILILGGRDSRAPLQEGWTMAALTGLRDPRILPEFLLPTLRRQTMPGLLRGLQPCCL